MDGVIPDRFRRELALHLFKNLMPNADGSVPLILGIHGPSGEGKTFQCQKVLEELGISASLVSGGELESVDAGKPAELVREKYLQCALRRGPGGLGLVALVFNDIDAAIGSWGDMVQYTVNRQNIFGELMHLADFPNVVEDRRVQRVPIILTGNDFSKLYGPLIRPGRMRSFSWIPDRLEKADVLRGVFSEMDEEQRLQLVGHFPDQPVAFFSHVRSQLIDETLWQHINEIGIAAAFAKLTEGRQPRIPVAVSIEALVTTGTNLLQTGEIIDHLRR